MDNTFWDKLAELKDSIGSDVEPQPEVTLPTTTIKLMLGITLAQSIGIALWWSIDTHAFYPWFIPVTTFLGIGWFWNKVTDSWRPHANIYSAVPIHSDSDDDSFVSPVKININNAGITGELDESNNYPHPSDEELFGGI